MNFDEIMQFCKESGVACKNILNTFLFTKWSTLKQRINATKVEMNFKERDVLNIYMGKNIGVESYGKGKEFLRPVIVYKKISNISFIGIPITSKVKDDSLPYYYSFHMNKENPQKESVALLTQIRVFDARRIKYKMGVISKEDFKKLHEELSVLIRPDEV